MKTKVALIGASSSGKTSCARALNGGSDAGDMDLGLDPSIAQTASTMIDWILRASVDFIAVSVHVRDDGLGIREVCRLKRNGGDFRLDQIHFVYLEASRQSLEERKRARLGEMCGNQAGYDDLDANDRLFRETMDEMVVTTGLAMTEVQVKVRAIADSAAKKAKAN